MKLTSNLPRPVAWITRIVAYGIFAAIALVIANSYGQHRLAQNALACMGSKVARASERPTALDHAQAVIACLQQKNGMLENFLMRSFSKPVMRLPSVPCKYVGVWLATRPQTTYRITLQDDGQFVAEPARAGADAHTFVGSWGVDNGSMIWITEGIWPPDVNRIRQESEGAFTLVERDGSQTAFNLSKPLEANACSR